MFYKKTPKLAKIVGLLDNVDESRMHLNREQERSLLDASGTSSTTTTGTKTLTITYAVSPVPIGRTDKAGEASPIRKADDAATEKSEG